MRRLFLCVLVVGLLGACGGDDALVESPTVEETEQAIIWKPVPGDWVDCEHEGKICKCKGDVVDCRKAKWTPPVRAVAP